MLMNLLDSNKFDLMTLKIRKRVVQSVLVWAEVYLFLLMQAKR
jgi:hypothetical protein